jgi:hypothetical protein
MPLCQVRERRQRPHERHLGIESRLTGNSVSAALLESEHRDLTSGTGRPAALSAPKDATSLSIGGLEGHNR